MTETKAVVVELDLHRLSEAEALGVDISTAANTGLQDAIRQARILQDLSDIEPDNGRSAASGFSLVASNNGTISLLSARRLPLEPKGELQNARLELRQALRSLSLEPGHRIRATYCEKVASTQLFDVENVLFYNVGTGSFRELSQHGIEFIHHGCRPDEFKEGSFGFRQRYSLVPNLVPSCVAYAETAFSLSRLTTTGMVSPVWWAARNSIWDQMLPFPGGAFGLMVDACPPVGWSGNPAALLKSLFDGIISSLQTQPAVTGDVLDRLSGQLKEPAHAIASALKNGSGLLGRNDALVRCYRDNTVWSPDDHHCMSGLFRLLPPAGDQWGIKATLSAAWR